MCHQQYNEVFKMPYDKTTEFISLYAKEECLWKLDSKSYTDKRARSLAVHRIVKALNLPEFRPEHVVMKLAYLRKWYAKELKKIANAIELGKRHLPSQVWFYKLDSFLRNYTDKPNIMLCKSMERKVYKQIAENVATYRKKNNNHKDMKNNNRYINNNVNRNGSNTININVIDANMPDIQDMLDITDISDITSFTDIPVVPNITDISDTADAPVMLVNPEQYGDEDWYVVDGPSPGEKMCTEEDLSNISINEFKTLTQMMADEALKNQTPNDIMVEALNRPREEECVHPLQYNDPMQLNHPMQYNHPEQLNHPVQINEAIQLNEPMQLNNDYFDDFGRYISSLLKALPEKKAMALQPHIINLITSSALETDSNLG